MRPAENIEKLIKDLRYKAGPRTYNKIFGKVLQALENKQKQKTAITQNTWRIIIKSPVIKLAAAAVIIIASCFFLTHQGQNGGIKTQQITQTAKSPAELTTFASLIFAYRQGGMEMVEKMCDKALKMAGQRPANISMQEFFEESNNGKPERTEL